MFGDVFDDVRRVVKSNDCAFHESSSMTVSVIIRYNSLQFTCIVDTKTFIACSRVGKMPKFRKIAITTCKRNLPAAPIATKLDNKLSGAGPEKNTVFANSLTILMSRFP